MSDQAFKQYDVVRLKALREPVHFESDGISRRAPRVGDVAAIIEVYKDPPGYELECSGSDGITEWLCAFSPNDIEFEKI